jgi:hypothetical protein
MRNEIDLPGQRLKELGRQYPTLASLPNKVEEHNVRTLLYPL